MSDTRSSVSPTEVLLHTKNSTSIEIYSASLSQLFELFFNFVFFLQYIIYPFFRDYTAGKTRSLRYFPVVKTVPYGMLPAATGNWPKSPDENPAKNLLSNEGTLL